MITEEYIRKMVNRCYPQEGLCKIPRKGINYSAQIEGGFLTLKNILAKWENLGYIKIINDIEFCKDEDICVEVLKFLDGKEFPQDWIRDRH